MGLGCLSTKTVNVTAEDHMMADKIRIEEVKKDAESAVLCWLATINQNGFPNVTPKELWSIIEDDQIIVADIASSNSVANICRSKKVCLSFVDVFRQRGFKIFGNAEILPKYHDSFSTFANNLSNDDGPIFEIRNIILIKILNVERILAPSYILFPDIKEEDMCESSYRTYGVRPRYKNREEFK